jgi:hypothetical protein
MSGLVTHLRRSPWVWGSLLFLLLSRVPAILCPFELDRDESQMAAQAMRYAQDLTPWRSVEGETNGPLDSWLLLAAHDLGMPLKYPWLHLLAALLLAAILLATYTALRRLAGEIPAQIGLVAGAWWLAWAPVQEFVHYSSELVPGLLLSLAVAVIARARQAESGPDWRRGLAAGILLGLAPWGKLQAGPVGLALGVWAVADGWFGNPAPAPIRRRYAAALLAGALLPAVLFLSWLVAAGAADEFWRVYIISGLYHGRARPWAVHLQNLEDLLCWRANSPWLWDSALLAVGALWLRRRSPAKPVPSSIRWLALLWLAAGIYVALRPITQWTHYAIFFLPPLMACAAILAPVLLGGRPRLGWTILALGVLPLPVANFLTYHYYVAAQAMASSRSAFAGEILLAQAVRHFVPEPKSLAVWGWKPSLYVDLGLPPATRNAVCAFLIDDNPNRDFLRAAYMRDLEKSQPEVIVDVEDYVYRGRRQSASESFPALAAYLSQNYVLAGSTAAPRTADYSLVIAIYTRRPN